MYSIFSSNRQLDGSHNINRSLFPQNPSSHQQNHHIIHKSLEDLQLQPADLEVTGSQEVLLLPLFIDNHIASSLAEGEREKGPQFLDVCLYSSAAIHGS